MPDDGADKVRTNVYLREEQKEEVDERSLNLSDFVRKRIDEWSDR